MFVNATGLGEMLAMPELSVQTAIRPGIPASVPDFLTIMALKAVPPAESIAVGLPSAGDGNPTAEGAQVPAVPSATPATDASRTAEREVDTMAFDLPLPAVPAPQSAAPEPKTSGARYAAVAARHLPAADIETPVPASMANGEGDASADTDAETLVSDTAGREDATDVIVPEALLTMPQRVQPPVPPATAAVPAETAAVASRAAEGGTQAVRPQPAETQASTGREQALSAPQAPVISDTAVLPENAGEAVTAAPAMQPGIQRAIRNPVPPLQTAARGDEQRMPVEAPGETDTETMNVSMPQREPIVSQMSQAVFATVHAAASDARALQSPGTLQDVGAQAEALLDDLFVGNAVADEWVDQLAADVETLVNGDRREARLHLKPRELGDLFIRLETTGNQAKVHFTVESSAAQGFIADAASRLQSMMETRGVHLQETSVDVGGGRQDRGEQPRETHFQQPFGGRPRGTAPQAETVRALVRQTAIERFA